MVEVLKDPEKHPPERRLVNLERRVDQADLRFAWLYGQVRSLKLYNILLSVCLLSVLVVDILRGVGW